MTQELIFLNIWEEVIGKIEGLESRNNSILVIFEGAILLLDKRRVDLESLKNHVGKKIGIFKIDLANKPFYFREIDSSKSKNCIFYDTRHSKENCPHSNYRGVIKYGRE